MVRGDGQIDVAAMVFLHLHRHHTIQTAAGQPDGADGYILRASRRAGKACGRDGIVGLQSLTGSFHHRDGNFLTHSGLLLQQLTVYAQQTLLDLIDIADNSST